MSLTIANTRELTSVRAINKACTENTMARAQGVYATQDQGAGNMAYGLRVRRARSVHGVLQVRIVGEGWIIPTTVYQFLS